MNPYVKEVKPLDDFQLDLIFESDERRMFDVKPYLNLGILHRLNQKSLFEAARVVAGSVEWPTGLDLSYDTLYVESKPFQAEASQAEVTPA